MLYHSARGDVGYTIVGTPTIVDGVVSGFTTTDYIKTQSAPQDTDVRNYELFTKIKINSIPTSTEFIMCYEAGSREGIAIINGGKIRFQTSRAVGTSGEPSIFSSACSVGDEVLIHTYYKGNNIWVLEISKDNGVTWETNTLAVTAELSEMNTARVITIGGSPFYSSGYKSPFVSGSIDLNHTYIKVNGQPWFGICPVEVKKHQIMGPVGYELSGNATVTDGILTGVDLSSSCLTPSLPSTFNTMEFMFKVAYPNAGSGAFIPICGFGGQGSARRIATSPSAGNRLLYSGSGEVIVIPNSDFNVISAFTQTGGYYVRLFVEKNTSDYTYTLGCSLDKNTWVEKTETIADNICYGTLSLLRNSSGTSNGKPQMDLNETYVKVNGKLWFWQPQETKRIVVNGVEVWTKPE